LNTSEIEEKLSENEFFLNEDCPTNQTVRYNPFG
jgi:hypothetical protein